MIRGRGSSGIARLLVAVVAVVALAALAAAPAAARKGPKGFFGLVPQAAPSSADIERMARGKVGAVRFSINWAAVEPSDDRFEWSAADDLVGDLAAAGIRPFVNVSGVPGYVGSNPFELPVRSATEKQQWQEFLRAAVGRYGRDGEYWTSLYPAQHPGAKPLPVKTWQIWNEQNGPKHVEKPHPGRYAELIKASHDAIAGEDARAEIVLGGMFGKPKGKGGIKAWSFLRRLYKTKGVKKSFDGAALHPYSPSLRGIKSQIRKLRKTMKKRKDKRAELWVTELGWGSKKKGRLGVGKKRQAKLLKQSFKLLVKQRKRWRIGGVLWYTWRDLAGSDAPCNWCVSAGLFPRNGTKPKPAWKQYVRFTGGR